MAENDDFEIINETGLSNEQTFELIDVNDFTDKKTSTDKPTTPDVVLPLPISKPLVNETVQIVQQQQTPTSTVNSSEPEKPHPPIKTTTPIVPFVPLKKIVPPPPPPPRTFAPVPSLPKAPPARRYGDAALIPHDADKTLDIDTVINKSRTNQQNTLHASTRQQQQQDMQTVLEQRRKLLDKK
jgi:hypothetical protein